MRQDARRAAAPLAAGHDARRRAGAVLAWGAVLLVLGAAALLKANQLGDVALARHIGPQNDAVAVPAGLLVTPALSRQAAQAVTQVAEHLAKEQVRLARKAADQAAEKADKQGDSGGNTKTKGGRKKKQGDAGRRRRAT